MMNEGQMLLLLNKKFTKNPQTLKLQRLKSFERILNVKRRSLVFSCSSALEHCRSLKLVLYLALLLHYYIITLLLSIVYCLLCNVNRSLMEIVNRLSNGGSYHKEHWFTQPMIVCEYLEKILQCNNGMNLPLVVFSFNK